MISAGIIVTGEEVLRGKTDEKNFKWLSVQLEALGIDVRGCMFVGDEKEDITDALKWADGRFDVVFITGGLGPTSDDITAEAAATFFNMGLELNYDALEQVKSFWNRINLNMPEKSEKQAFLPKNSFVIPNPIGSAPGFYIKYKKSLFFFLPGVPKEVKRIFKESIVDILEKELNLDRYTKERCIVTFGIIESKIMEKLQDFHKVYPDIKIGYRIKFPEVLLYLRNYGKSIQALKDATEWIAQKLGEKIVSTNGKGLPEVVGDVLRSKGFTLAVAESCTGGLIGHLITNVSGSSDYFLLGCVVYSNEAKKEVLEVKEDTLNSLGAVHEKTAIEMAVGVRKLAKSTFGLSTTGIAGPTGGSKEKPVGTICIGIAGPNGVRSFKFRFSFNDRLLHKKIFAYTALDLLRKEIFSFLT